MATLAVHEDPEGAAEGAAIRLAAAINGAVAARGWAHVCLAGGSTPRRAYELLPSMLNDATRIDWWFGDERLVPPDDDRSNYRLVETSLLSDASIPTDRVRRVRIELGPSDAAAAYASELMEAVTANERGIPVLDAAFLGLGEDGHTASLFPGDAALDVDDQVCVPVWAPKPPFERVSLTLPVLRAAGRAVILAVGKDKANAVRSVLAGADRRVPASLIERAELVVDAAAGG